MGSAVLRPNSQSGSLFDNDQSKAEKLLLDLADYVYGNTSLKPMSKTLFVISRCLLVVDEGKDLSSTSSVADVYEQLRKRLGIAAPVDDYAFETVLLECAAHLDRIISTLSEVRRLTRGSDCIGLAFDSLLRGKIEGGEGLGTYLTPEEVVGPMVQMGLASMTPEELRTHISEDGLFGDICGGTGRFLFRMSEELRKRGVSRKTIEGRARLYDQSRLAVDLARINFILQDERPLFSVVSDSIVDEAVSSESSRYFLLATNPPFGVGKYRLSLRGLEWLPSALVQSVASSGRGGAADPAVLFLLRNLDLLRIGGVLAIVLPDGIARGAFLRSLLLLYESTHRCGIDIMAAVSLPATTFALGGTVAKTSYLILRKSKSPRVIPTFSAAARHVGFLKKGNRRAVDPHGNDLPRIAEEYGNAGWEHRARIRDWRAAGGANPSRALMDDGNELPSTVRDFAEPIRSRARDVSGGSRGFHISILDVDATGLIDVIAASHNNPASRGITCHAGDVLVSCINPSHWRVAVVPAMEGDWSCSPEFLVLRPKAHSPLAGWELALRLHHQDVIVAARQAASGTSSSRQRVEKDTLVDVELPLISYEPERVNEHMRSRMAHYEQRLKEEGAYTRLHDGEMNFIY